MVSTITLYTVHILYVWDLLGALSPFPMGLGVRGGDDSRTEFRALSFCALHSCCCTQKKGVSLTGCIGQEVCSFGDCMAACLISIPLLLT